jgi:hypothetical protein
VSGKTASEVAFPARALKAPRIRERAAALAEREAVQEQLLAFVRFLREHQTKLSSTSPFVRLDKETARKGDLIAIWRTTRASSASLAPCSSSSTCDNLTAVLGCPRPSSLPRWIQGPADQRCWWEA